MNGLLCAKFSTSRSGHYKSEAQEFRDSMSSQKGSSLSLIKSINAKIT